MNIPVINLRREFDDFLELFRSTEFKHLVYDCQNQPIKFSSFTWHGLSNGLLTFMMQRAILGLESYLCAAVSYEATRRLAPGDESLFKVKRPHALGSNVFSNLYQTLPGLIGAEFTLSAHSQKASDDLRNFYKDVRNPLFHGNEVSFGTGSYESVAEAFELLSKIYEWIDSWFSIFPARFKGAVA